jgi:hypothetical protein
LATVSERPKRWRVFDKIADSTLHVIVFAGIWVIFSVVGLLFVGFRSTSPKYWIIPIVAFPFLYFALEAVGELLRGIPPIRTTRNAVDEATKEKPFSGLRILYLLIETLVLLSMATGVWYFGRAMVYRWFL